MQLSSGLPGTAACRSSLPISKYPLLAQQLLAEECSRTPTFAEVIDIATLHCAYLQYLDKLQSSGLSTAEQRRLGLPWSEHLATLAASAGTLLAARAALSDGMAANLAGGTHQAFADHGEGFCVLNDVAVAISKLRAEGTLERAAVIDLDVHQGNGTAAIFENVEEVFTFSMHGERNYPLAKMRSTVDVPLRDGVGDADTSRPCGGICLDGALEAGHRSIWPVSMWPPAIATANSPSLRRGFDGASEWSSMQCARVACHW